MTAMAGAQRPSDAFLATGTAKRVSGGSSRPGGLFGFVQDLRGSSNHSRKQQVTPALVIRG